MSEKRCENCRWLEYYKGRYICGYIAEIYHIASYRDSKSTCNMKKYEKRNGD